MTTTDSTAADVLAVLAENERLRKALAELTHNASEVNRLGAQTGSQWFRLTGSLITARAALAPRDRAHLKGTEA